MQRTLCNFVVGWEKFIWKWLRHRGPWTFFVLMKNPILRRLLILWKYWYLVRSVQVLPVGSFMHCLRKCSDKVTHQCSLISAWNFQGNPLYSSTSQATYFPHRPPSSMLDFGGASSFIRRQNRKMPYRFLFLLPAASVQSTKDQAFFETLSIGSTFTPTQLSASHGQLSSIERLVECFRACLSNILCRTTNFDAAIQQCSLFSAWNFGGNLALQCVHGTWICPDGYFFNGAVREHRRAFNDSCRWDSSVKWNGALCNQGQ